MLKHIISVLFHSKNNQKSTQISNLYAIHFSNKLGKWNVQHLHILRYKNYNRTQNLCVKYTKIDLKHIKNKNELDFLNFHILNP